MDAITANREAAGQIAPNPFLICNYTSAFSKSFITCICRTSSDLLILLALKSRAVTSLRGNTAQVPHHQQLRKTGGRGPLRSREPAHPIRAAFALH